MALRAHRETQRGSSTRLPPPVREAESRDVYLVSRAGIAILAPPLRTSAPRSRPRAPGSERADLRQVCVVEARGGQLLVPSTDGAPDPELGAGVPPSDRGTRRLRGVHAEEEMR